MEYVLYEVLGWVALKPRFRCYVLRCLHLYDHFDYNIPQIGAHGKTLATVGLPSGWPLDESKQRALSRAFG